jgi:hypothetical protein
MGVTIVPKVDRPALSPTRRRAERKFVVRKPQPGEGRPRRSVKLADSIVDDTARLTPLVLRFTTTS